MRKITKALIPAAGLGTRFLPATKSVPKEMLPVVDRPILLYVVEEAVKAGIEDIVIIAGRGKTAIENFFDSNFELELHLEKSGRLDLLEEVKKINSMANIISIRQKEALGLGHAVLCGAPVVGKEDFAVLLGDEIMYSQPEQKTVTDQLITVYNETGLSTVAVMTVPESEVEKYGIISGEKTPAGHIQVKDVIEKPRASETPSRLALPGRYVFTNKIFTSIRETKPGRNQEIQLSDAMVDVALKYGMLATEFIGRRFDAGDRLGYLIANIELALLREGLSSDLKSYLQERVKTL